MKKSPFYLDFPSLLMNFPFSVDNKILNNSIILNEPFDYPKTFLQYYEVYKKLSQHFLIYLVPSEENLQDLPYVSNAGLILKHIDNTAIMSNFTSFVRVGEEKLVGDFLRKLKYNVIYCPFCWEGEADLKWIRDNVYIGGYGIRSTIEAFQWMEENFNMKIIPVKLTDEKLYHLDCSLFPLSEDKTLISMSSFSKEDLKKIESVTGLIDTPKKYIYDGWTNSIKVKDKIFNGFCENESSLALEKLLDRVGYSIEFLDISEFEKSGAGLSCMVLYLNNKN